MVDDTPKMEYYKTNVRKKNNGAFVYSIQLKENKNIEASPSLGSHEVALNRMLNASNNSISNIDETVNEDKQFLLFFEVETSCFLAFRFYQDLSANIHCFLRGHFEVFRF